MSAKPREKSFDAIGVEFRRQRESLAKWALRHLVNRQDAYIWYLPLDRRSDCQKARTVKKTPTKHVLRRRFGGASPGDVIGLHSTSPDNACRWVALDLDCHEDNPELAYRNNLFAVAVANLLLQLRLQPLVLDSDGRGGFHILVLFSEPFDSVLAYRFGKWLIRGWKSFGINEPETFPKQPKLGEGLLYGCALRVLGRHHTRPHWTRVITPDGPTVGEEACEVVLATRGAHPSLIPSEAREYQTTEEMLRTTTILAPRANRPASVCPRRAGLANEMPDELARKYLQKVPPAIQGQRGDEQLWKTACMFLRAFRQLTPESAFCFFREWNQKCVPPFDEVVIWDKLCRAARKVG